MNSSKKIISQILLYTAVIAIVAFCLFPFLQMVSVSVKDIHDRANPSLIPKEIHLDAYKEILGFAEVDEAQSASIQNILKNPNLIDAQRDAILKKYENKNPFPFPRFMLNSFIFATVSTFISMTCAIFAAYAMARMEFRGMSIMRRGTLFVYLLGGVILMVPLYQMGAKLGLINNKVGVFIFMMLIYVMQTIPLALYMLGNYFRDIPYSIEEAAMIDGCTKLQTITKIIIPLSKPILVTVFVYCFIIGWNEYLYASVFLKPFGEMRTLSIAINELFFSKNDIWDRIMAASTLTLAPVLVFFFTFSKNMVAGMSDGGVKG